MQLVSIGVLNEGRPIRPIRPAEECSMLNPDPGRILMITVPIIKCYDAYVSASREGGRKMRSG